MAGSYKHVTDEKGNIRSNEDMMFETMTIENLGDAYEAIEEMYGMIWMLAGMLAEEVTTETDAPIHVEIARKNYQQGLTFARSVNGSHGD